MRGQCTCCKKQQLKWQEKDCSVGLQIDESGGRLESSWSMWQRELKGSCFSAVMSMGTS